MSLQVKALAALFNEKLLVVETEARLRRANGLVIHRSVNCNRALRTGRFNACRRARGNARNRR